MTRESIVNRVRVAAAQSRLGHVRPTLLSLEFRYLILVELDGHITDRSVLAAVEELRSAGRYVKVVGSYPRVHQA